jgi:hypothetical protein
MLVTRLIFLLGSSDCPSRIFLVCSFVFGWLCARTKSDQPVRKCVSLFLFFCCCSVLQLTLPFVHFSFFRFLLMRVSYRCLVSARGFYGSQVTAPVPSARAGRDFSICAVVSRSDFQYRSRVQFSSPASSALRSLLLLAVTWFQGIPQQILSSCFSLASRQGSSCPCWSWFLALQFVSCCHFLSAPVCSLCLIQGGVARLILCVWCENLFDDCRVAPVLFSSRRIKRLIFF